LYLQQPTPEAAVAAPPPAPAGPAVSANVQLQAIVIRERAMVPLSRHRCYITQMQGVRVVPALQAVAIGLAIRFLAPIPAGISPQVCSVHVLLQFLRSAAASRPVLHLPVDV